MHPIRDGFLGLIRMNGLLMAALLLAPPALLLTPSALLLAPSALAEEKAEDITVPSNKFAAIDRHALATPKSAERSIDSLAAYLTRPARTELEKARAVFRWVTHNIAYDADAFFSRRFRNSRATPQSVLKSRSGVCDGYARIYEGLAKAAGLEVVRVSGYAKGFGYETGDDIPKAPNHAWNAVKVGGRWILVDTTWGAGSVSSKTRSFVRKYQEHYFQTKPEEMIYAHLPGDPKWQLLDGQVSRREFAALPKLRPLFFQHKLRLLSHPDAEIITGNQVEVIVEAPAGIEMSARVHERILKNERPLERSLSTVRREGNRFIINARFPKKGPFVLRLYAKRGEREGAYGAAMDYAVVASQGTRERFPFYLPPYFSDGLKLDSHKEGIIRADDQVELSLLVPPDVNLTAHIYRKGKKLEENLSYLRRDGGRFRIFTLYPRPGEYELKIFSKPARAKGPLDWALSYTVLASKGTKERFPRYGESFFALGLKLESHPNGIIKTGKQLELRLGAPPHVALIASLLRDGKKVPGNLLHIQREGGIFRIKVLFPRRGRYTLRIFSKDRASNDKASNAKGGKGGNISYDFALDYQVTATRGAGAQAGFPVFYSRYNQQGARLHEPMEGNLKAGTTRSFRIEVPGAIHVAVVVGKKWTQLTQLHKKGGVFQGEVRIARGKIVVFANFSGGEGSYAGLLQYRGR